MKLKKTAALILAAVLCVPFVGVKQVQAMNVTSYYDYDFDQPGETNKIWTNLAGNDSYAIVQNATTIKNGETHALSTDGIRGSKAIKISLPKAATSTLYRIGQEGVNLDGLDSSVIWYEISFMCETAFMGLNVNATNYPFAITQNGEIYLGGLKNTPVQNGQKVTNAALELGQWYHLVVAIDPLSRSTDGFPKIYGWLNGELLQTAGSAEGCSAIWNNINSALPISKMTNLRLQFVPNDTSKTVFWMDNFKFYTTDEPVQAADGSFCFDPMAIFEGAELSSDELKIENNVIYAPADETLGSLSLLLKSGASGIGFHDGSKAVSDAAALAVTKAVGTKVFARSTSGIGVKAYTVAEGHRLFDRVAENAALQTTDGTAVNFADVKAGDTVVVSLPFVNDLQTPKSGVLITAAYDGTELLAYSMKAVNIPVGGDTALGEAVTIPTLDELERESIENLKIKAYIWTAETDNTPLLSRVEWE